MERLKRVYQAAAPLGYKPNLLAQRLTTKMVNPVAVILNHIHDLSDINLFDRPIDRIQSIGKQVFMIRIASVERAEEFLRNEVAYDVDGAFEMIDHRSSKRN